MNNEQGIRVLQRVRKLLEDPSRWTNRAWAKDKRGNICAVSSPHAVCWCLEGALRRIAPNGAPGGYVDAVLAIKECSLATINDRLYENKDHTGLLALIDRGITRLKGGRLKLNADITESSRNRQQRPLF